MIAQAVQYNNVCGQKQETPPYNHHTVWVDFDARNGRALQDYWPECSFEPSTYSNMCSCINITAPLSIATEASYGTWRTSNFQIHG